jgi:hypothetical protein
LARAASDAFDVSQGQLASATGALAGVTADVLDVLGLAVRTDATAGAAARASAAVAAIPSA